MKPLSIIISIVFFLNLLSPTVFAITSCEQLILKASEKNYSQKLKVSYGTRVKEFFSPEKTNWNEVHRIILKNPHRGNPETEAWLKDLIDRASRGESTWEEHLAALVIINPDRGLKALEYAKANKLLRYRTKLFETGLSSTGRAVGDSQIGISLKNLVERDVIKIPSKVEDFEKYMYSLYVSLGPKEPHLFTTVLAKENAKIPSWGKAYRITEKERDAYMLEARLFYDDLKKLTGGEAKLSDLDKFTRKYLEKPWQELKAAGYDAKLSPEELLAKLYAEHGLRQTKHYYWKLTYALAMFAIMGPFLDQQVEQMQNMKAQSQKEKEYYDEEYKKQLAGYDPNTHDVIVFPESTIIDAKYPDELLRTQLNEGKIFFDPFYSEKNLKVLNDSGKEDEENFPCDPKGTLFKNVKSLSAKEKEAKSLYIQNMIKAMYLNPTNLDADGDNSGKCLLRIKKQLYEKDISKAMTPTQVIDQMNK